MAGIGEVCGNEIYHDKIPQDVDQANIATLEMFNILVALRIWAIMWQHQTVLFRCDNEAVVAVLNSGKTRDPDLAAISRNIFMHCATFDTPLKIIHISGKDNNIADLLSRWDQTINPREKLKSLLPNFRVMLVEKQHMFINHNI